MTFQQVKGWMFIFAMFTALTDYPVQRAPEQVEVYVRGVVRANGWEGSLEVEEDYVKIFSRSYLHHCANLAQPENYEQAMTLFAQLRELQPTVEQLNQACVDTGLAWMHRAQAI